MSFIRRHDRLLPALLLVSGLALPAAAQQEKPVEPDSLTGGDRRFGLIINGFAAGNFNYNFNTDENSFDSSALAVSLFRSLSDRVSFFGQLTVHKEEASPFVEAAGPERIRSLARHAAEGGESSFSTEIDNLQVSWAADPARGLSVVFGKFDSPIAIERDDAPLNFQATPSFVFDFGRPVKFTGLMARQTFSPKFEGYAILANGWDVDSDNNRAKTGALYGIWSPWPIAHFGLGVIHGAEKDGRTGDRRTTGVATILVQQTTRGCGARNSCTEASPIPRWTAARRSGSATCSSRTTGWANTGRSRCAPTTSTTWKVPARGIGRSFGLSRSRPNISSVADSSACTARSTGRRCASRRSRCASTFDTTGRRSTSSPPRRTNRVGTTSRPPSRSFMSSEPAERLTRSSMGRLPQSPLEVRLAVTLFLGLLGIADFFGAWQVRNFAAFTPRGVAATVAPEEHHGMAMECCTETTIGERPMDPASLDHPTHRITRDLLVQDTHVHVPVYAMTAAFLSLVVFGLRLSSRVRTSLVLCAFAAPLLDFAGLWGAHFAPASGAVFGAVAVAGGFAMGICYLVVFLVAIVQLWFLKENTHA